MLKVNPIILKPFYSEEFVLGTDQSGKAWQNVLIGYDKADSKPADAVTNYLFCGDCGLDTGLGQDLFAT